jgi:hypothetical protein
LSRHGFDDRLGERQLEVRGKVADVVNQDVPRDLGTRRRAMSASAATCPGTAMPILGGIARAPRTFPSARRGHRCRFVMRVHRVERIQPLAVKAVEGAVDAFRIVVENHSVAARDRQANVLADPAHQHGHLDIVLLDRLQCLMIGTDHEK